MPLRYLITGATGFIGSHLARACNNYGYEVVSIARPDSKTDLLRELGVVIHQGDISDPRTAAQALEDVDTVVHCAAAQGNQVGEYRKTNVQGLRVLLEACKGHALSRFVHLSCTTVYPAGHHFGADESTALPRRQRDACAQSKVEAEQLVIQYYRDFGVPVVVLRPGLVYGPRERHIMPWLIERLRQRRLRYLGSQGRGALDTLFVRNLIDGIFLAVDNAQAVGRAYNLTDGEFVSKRRFLETVAAAVDVPPPRSSQSLWAARLGAWCSRLRGGDKSHISSFALLRLLGFNLDFSIERARQELGYRPRTCFDDAIAETMAWYKSQIEPRTILEARVSNPERADRRESGEGGIRR